MKTTPFRRLLFALIPLAVIDTILVLLKALELKPGHKVDYETMKQMLNVEEQLA